MKAIPMGHLLQTTGLIDTMDPLRARIFLRPGDWLVGLGPHEVSTLLGSCVSVVMWAPRLRMGGMCHCLLPQRPPHLAKAAVGRAGHYVDEALDWLVSSLGQAGIATSEVQVSLAGGAHCVDSGIGDANVRAALEWLARRGLRPLRCDTGGTVVRKLHWSLGTGELQIATGGRMDLERA